MIYTINIINNSTSEHQFEKPEPKKYNDMREPQSKTPKYQETSNPAFFNNQYLVYQRCDAGMSYHPRQKL